ncbi:diguanylate cyclase [Polycladidibacter hongkongensis]|uniref:diguanylate cyclase n=1 Tax=Polycladidibacter hongkongensis TaxID=1647556 RepID=UPI000AA24BD3|nr:diguanylate cyclase [Pseudovibrio hongkongensis]
MRPKKRVLLVEDANFFTRVISNELEKCGRYEVATARSFEEAKQLLASGAFAPFMALVDLTLPDARNGEIVDLTVAAGLPTVVFSGRFDETIRRSILSKGVVDYVLKDTPSSLNYLSDLVRRIDLNRSTHVLIVDDAPVDLSVLRQRLERYCLNVLMASTGQDALQILTERPDIRLMLLDHGLPDMSGFDVLSQVRRMRGVRDLAVLGISASPTPELTAKFLKCGASDFLAKASSPEELILRISQNLNQLDRIQELKVLANQDPMTRFYNRRYLYSEVDLLHARLRNEGKSLRYAMVDIDRFKRVNDQFGHDVGDWLILEIAERIDELLPNTALAIRMGGDEFCLALPDTDREACKALLSSLRLSMPLSIPGANDDSMRPTVSIGVSDGTEATLRDGLRAADTCLYEAKRSGRNKVIMASEL